jgi:hypothetical protein
VVKEIAAHWGKYADTIPSGRRRRWPIVPCDGQVPQVPPGFTATSFATGLADPRRLLVLPNGDVLVAEQSAGYLTLLRDDGQGRAIWIDRHVEEPPCRRVYPFRWRPAIGKIS